jgi:hypothetical protein
VIEIIFKLNPEKTRLIIYFHDSGPGVEKGMEEKETEETSLKSIDNAVVIYFDTFKKKAYMKTFIFQKEYENDKKLYRLIGFCEAPMA